MSACGFFKNLRDLLSSKVNVDTLNFDSLSFIAISPKVILYICSVTVSFFSVLSFLFFAGLFFFGEQAQSETIKTIIIQKDINLKFVIIWNFYPGILIRIDSQLNSYS